MTVEDASKQEVIPPTTEKVAETTPQDNTTTDALKEVETGVVTDPEKQALQEHEKTILPADESMRINGELLLTIKTELENTNIGSEKTELLLSKIGELTPPTIATNIRTWWERVKKAWNFLEKFGLKLPSEEIAWVATNIAETTDQIEDAKNQLDSLKKEASDAFHALVGWKMESITWNFKIDQAFWTFENKMNEIKWQTWIDEATHYAWVTVALSAFLSALKQPTTTPAVAGWSVAWTSSTESQKLEDEELGDDNDYTQDLVSDKLETNRYPIWLPIKWFTKSMVTSDFWPRSAPKQWASTNHKGIDIGVADWTPILAPADGKIIWVKNQWDKVGAWLYIDVDHGSFITRYMHLSRQDVKEWQMVKQWDVIGASWNTGNSTGPHLHYEIRYKWQIVDASKTNAKKYLAVDPMHFIDTEGDWKVLAMNDYKIIEGATPAVA